MSKKMKTSTTRDLRYLQDSEKFLGYSFEALKAHFLGRPDFDAYFAAITSEDRKSLFLRAASFYLFMVKNGDCHVRVEESDKVVDYLTNTFKYIGIFSLVESLSDERFVDFYEYLSGRSTAVPYPIQDRVALDALYKNYKSQHGSVVRCVSFFKNLPPARQQDLVRRLVVHGTDPSIEHLAQYLYELRSRFVHQAEFVHHMSSGTSVSFRNGELMVCSLSIADAMQFFEEGLIEYFKN